MTYIDNMGSFISCKFILLNELDSLIVSPSEAKCSINLTENSAWKELDTQYQGIQISVDNENPDAGMIFNISGSIIIKKNSGNLPLLRTYTSIILAAVNTDRKTRIFGDKEYPLQAVLYPLTPAAVSGFVGYRLDISGSQLFEPPILDE